ncbi:MAG: glycosyltransferase family 2 protein [Phycisphaerales bacterium]|nr:glycosyltransferase family 2 protein [Phycisphaerales bacterium]
MIGVLMVILFVPLGLFWSLWLLFAAMAALPAKSSGRQACRLNKECCLIDILIPAHDEELLLPELLKSLREQTAAGKSRMGMILVIADHCTDATAAFARSFGATVLERSTGPRGKPAALRDGLDFLKVRTRHALMILDADCVCCANYLEAMADALDAGNLALQSASLLVPENATTTSPLSPSQLAFALKDFIRPQGMSWLGIPTQLFGTGMCFHPDVLHSDALCFHDHLAEDLALSHHLLLRGISVAFVADAMIRSPLPTTSAAMSQQKLRWETGQVQTWRKIPSLLVKLLLAFRWRSAIALLDWSAPPLAMAVFTWVMLTVVTFILIACRLISPWIVLAPLSTIAILALYVLIGTLQLATLGAVVRLTLAVPRFLLWKAALYLRMLTGHFPTHWQRTPRGAVK